MGLMDQFRIVNPRNVYIPKGAILLDGIVAQWRMKSLAILDAALHALAVVVCYLVT